MLQNQRYHLFYSTHLASSSKPTAFFYFTPMILHGNPSASSWLPEAGAACTLKSWQEKESHFLSMKNVVSWSSWLTAKKKANEMHQRNLVFLRLHCVVCSNNEKQSAASDGDRKQMRMGKAPVVAAALVKWIDNARSRNAPLNWPFFSK